MTSKTARLVLVELRRATDTPGPRWAIGTCVAAGLALALFQPGGTPKSFATFVSGATLALPLLVALLSVMAFTADWTTRAALVTFAITPRRSMVLAARSIAVLLISVGLVVALHVVAAITYVLVRPSSAATVVDPATASQFGSMVGLTIAVTLTTVSVAGLVLRTSLALVVAVLAPFFITIGLVFVPEVSLWFGPYSFANWLAAPTWHLQVKDGIGIGPAFVSFVVWTVVPFALSWLRQVRAEPR